MKLFSQRKGLKPVKSVMQIDSMDSDLRNGLWNSLVIFYWDQVKGDWLPNYTNVNLLLKILWLDYFKKPIDTIKNYWEYTYEEIRKYFFNCPWYEVYDFIEFIANNYPEERTNQKFMDFCNSILEKELSAYRFVGGKITQITSEVEISQIEEALEVTSPFKAVNIHLKSALDLLSDRKSPDYRNSIKESISAVEAICKLIVKDEKATLSEALKKIDDKLPLHSALKKAFDNLYGYTSNAEGIRHALLNEPNLSFEDAKFMLVSCSAFINYLINKAQKAGIKI
ncbi:AbiJ-NTD4 domain-containing protein [Thermodesulfovibrio yellowstonii]|uniref:HEPN AbiJ-N-terminal domain-containing protein n=1 Tax=Thermodesulfovibrio yellowstonii (strain ATCC 51303 / DSM 11347 / YP87) TaxID=289376 RepID=B5YJE9_THEYD|nr:hypothetical protein [Thermodesulfovibrio yellowstonii]ACI21649.1 conserved hypothetical protein [Thermodesulfovibrio yellowstonii DSM 11347]MDI6864383.1 hypothetical protein [Thermodesulfovibrio yellowstonii]